MTILNHTLGFPRVGLRRELKKAQESYWAGNSTREELLAVGRELRARHWDQQKQAGIDLLPVGDFAWYDHVLTTSLLLGNVPARHQNKDGSVDIDTLFRIGRGRAPTGEPAAAAEMTKWFNTNYHYMVPEFVKGQQFKLTWTQLLDEVDEALALGHKVKPVLLGPVTWLWLGKVKGEQFDRLSLLNDILPVYQQVLAELAKRGVNCIGIPATIDLDMNNTEYTIGFDTAVNTGMDALNKLRDTSSSHERCSVVEVMGRDAGYIAIWCGMVGGAEDVMFPEEKGEVDSAKVIQQILENRSIGKRHNLIVVAEGVGGTQKLAKEIQEITGIQTRATILGHLQRGGSPTAVDRMHASMMGYHAVKAILAGEQNKVVAYNRGRYEILDLEKALKMEKTLDREVYEVIKILAI